ncbi:MAG: NifU family protein [Phycisphaerales bacterium]|nr:NifU family protein [Phycisphaerales bacterium]
MSSSLEERVRAVIDWMRPIVQSDGGDVELVEVSAEGVVRIRFHGACVGCPSSPLTLKEGLERILKEKMPEVREVVAII